MSYVEDMQVECICWDSPKDMPTLVLPCCGKAMHQPCLVQWVIGQSTCPYYRNDISLDGLMSALCEVDPEPKPTLTAPSVSEPGLPVNWENARVHVSSTNDTPRTKVQQEAKKVNRKRQIAQEIRENKRLKMRSVGASGVEPGAVVAVRNDLCDVSHAHGTVGIAYDCRPTGGVKICTQWGMITQRNSHTNYWIPKSRYVVKFKPGQDAVIDREL